MPIYVSNKEEKQTQALQLTLYHESTTYNHIKENWSF